MIIWSGHGILIPIFWGIGLFLGGMLGALLGAVFGEDAAAGLGVVFSGGAGAGMVWLYALTLGKPVEQELLDPRTRQPVILRKRHSFFFIPAFAWAILSSLAALPIAIMGFVALGNPESGEAESGGQVPGANELREAEVLIFSHTKGLHHGNTEEARELAARFSEILTMFRDAAIQPGKTSRISASGNNFLTYCQLSDHGTAFLVHVPSLRKYTSEAKEVIADAAWHAANLAVAGMDPKPERLAVGVRGIVIYETIWLGKPMDPDDESDSPGERSKHGSTESELLHPFFAPDISLSTEEVTDTDPAPGEPGVPPTEDERVEAAAAPPMEVRSEREETSPASPAPDMTVPVADTPVDPLLPTGLRDWKAADGRVMRAALLRFEGESGDMAEFRREDGAVFTIPVERFDAGIQAELRELFQAVGQE